MFVNYNIICAEQYLPSPRHRKLRYRKIETTLTLNVKEAEPENFQKAYKIITPSENNKTKEYDIWLYQNNYYKNIKENPTEYNVQFFEFNEETQQYYWNKKIHRWNEYNPDNNENNTLEKITREKEIALSQFICYNNELYIRLEAAPTYCIKNFNQHNYIDIDICFKKHNIENYSDNVFFPDERCLLEDYIRKILPRIHQYRVQKLKIINTQLKTQIIPYKNIPTTKRPKLQKDDSYFIVKDKPIYYRLNNKHLVKEELYYNGKAQQIESSGFILYNNFTEPKILYSAPDIEEIKEYLKKNNM